MAPSLTEHLISLTPSSLKVATEHPFLLEAGKGTLSPDRLAAWLTQDRLYGLMGYTKLLGGLLQRCPSFDVPPGHPKSDLYWKRLRVLGGAMSVSEHTGGQSLGQRQVADPVCLDDAHRRTSLARWPSLRMWRGRMGFPSMYSRHLLRLLLASRATTSRYLACLHRPREATLTTVRDRYGPKRSLILTLTSLPYISLAHSGHHRLDGHL